MRNDSKRSFMLALLLVSALSVASTMACAQLTEDQVTALQRKAETGDAQTLAALRLAAEQGDALAQHSLGYMYANGRSVPQNDAEAMKWYRNAAEREFAPAQTNLGFMYDYGRGVPKNYAEAVKWFGKAAEQGDLAAQKTIWGSCTKMAGTYRRTMCWPTSGSRYAKQAPPQGSANYNNASKRMTPDQVARAQQGASAWRASHSGAH